MYDKSMALDSITEGIRPPITKEPPKAPPKEPIPQPTTQEASKPGLLKRFLSSIGKKQEAKRVTHQLSTQEQEELDKSRTLLQSAAMKGTARNFAVPESRSELASLKRIGSLTQLTLEEVQRKAELIAQNEADAAHEQLTPTRVAEVKRRLILEQDRAELKASPMKTGPDDRQSGSTSFQELKRLEAISSQGALTTEELHRKAVLTAEKERQPLTEAYVAEVEERLKAELTAKQEQASPEPVGAGTKQ